MPSHLRTTVSLSSHPTAQGRNHSSMATRTTSDPTPGHWASNHSHALGWLLSVAVAIFGGLLRFIRLDAPHAIIFDETYYVKDAWTMLMTGEPRDWPKTVVVDGTKQTIDTLFAHGDVTDWFSTAEYVVHPPIGKWCIALGLKLFGGATNPFAWRASTAIAGTIAIILLIRVTLRLMHNLPLALLSGILMSIDGLGIVMSRTGLLDNFIMVFALAAFSLLLMHRDWAQQRLFEQFAIDSHSRFARWVPHMNSYQSIRFPSHRASDAISQLHDPSNTTGSVLNMGGSHDSKPRNTRHAYSRNMTLNQHGPTVAFSWYRAGAAVLLGLATGVKWSGIYFFAVFCVISVIWDAWQRHQVGYRGWFSTGFKDGLLAAVYMVPIWAMTYLAGWTGWFIHKDSYMRSWALSHPGQGVTWLPDSLRSFVQYHIQMWQFHTTLETPHPYMANPLTWPLQIRPTSFYWEKLSGHPGLCSLSPDAQCVAAVTSLGNPLLWWLGSFCVVVGIIIAMCKRGDWRIWAVLAGLLGGWLPWAQYLHRTTFTFYSIVILPWIILAICYVANWYRQQVSARMYHRTIAMTVSAIGLVTLFFYPIWTAMPVPYEFWLGHMWLHSWI